MLEIYLKLLPVFGWFLLGVVLRTCKLLREEHGARLLKIMFFFTLPILVMVKLTGTDMRWLFITVRWSCACAISCATCSGCRPCGH